MNPSAIQHIHISVFLLRYPADLVWAKHLNKAERGINASLRRQQLHILQWVTILQFSRTPMPIYP